MAIQFAPKRSEAPSAKPRVTAEPAEAPTRLRKPGGGRKLSSDPKEVVTLRLPRSEIERWKAGGDDWRSRMAAVLAKAVE